jgi:hypothetical protein
VTVAEARPGLGGVEPSLVVHQGGDLLLPDAEHLSDFLFQGHSGNQVGHPFVHR